MDFRANEDGGIYRVTIHFIPAQISKVTINNVTAGSPNYEFELHIQMRGGMDVVAN